MTVLIQPLDESVEVADPVAVGVVEGLDVQLVEHDVLVQSGSSLTGGAPGANSGADASCAAVSCTAPTSQAAYVGPHQQAANDPSYLMGNFAARLHVLLARDAPLGVVIRRGPSKVVATILWNRATDEFELGQWLKGRIYERRSDLSPDGKHLIYFAMNGKWKEEAGGSWTAISRAPYLKAIALFPKGDCWHGGGLWTGDTRYWINDGYGHTVLRDTKAVRRDLKWQPPASYGGECPGVYYLRLAREGWALKETIHWGKWNNMLVTFEKPCPKGWILRKLAHAEVGAPPGKGCYWDEHELVHPSSGAAIRMPGWEWAELDGERLVWAEQGRLEAGRLTAEGLVERRMLADFNEMEFAPVEAPY
jgi:hypothetical protein